MSGLYPEPGGEEFTAGHAGSQASQERAQREQTGGIVSRRQAYIMERLATTRERGQTVKDLRDRSGLHHGQVSSTLTTLHRAGRIACLAEQRDRCHIYVLPEHVDGRETREPGEIRTNTGVERQFDWFVTGYLAGAGWEPRAMTTEIKANLRVVFDYLKAMEDQK